MMGTATIRYRKFLLLALTLLLCASCSTSTPAGSSSRVSLALEFYLLGETSEPLILENMASLRLRIFPSTMDDSSETLFDSDCYVPGSPSQISDEIVIENLPSGEGRTILFQGFSDTNCHDLLYIGFRGGVTVPDGPLPENTYYYVQVIRVGGFSLLPFPDDELRHQAQQTTCQTATECEAVHSAAICNPYAQKCELNSYFPFNLRVIRAFHTMTTLSDGKILIAGGFKEISPDGTVNSKHIDNRENFEVFDPMLGIFSSFAPKGENPATPFAFHSAVAVNGNQAVISGGLEKMTFTLKGGAIQLPPELKLSGCLNSQCVKNEIRIISLKDNTIAVGTLPVGVAAHESEWLGPIGKERVLITGGRDDKGQPTATGYACPVTATPTSHDCQNNKAYLNFPRFEHAGVCIDRQKDGTCAQGYLVFGGAQMSLPESPPLIELYRDGAFTPIKPTGINHEVVRGARLLQSDGTIYCIGGLEPSSDVSIPNVDASIVTVDGDSVTFSPVDLGDQSPTIAHRIYHQVLALDDGTVMVAGGLAHNLMPTNSVLFFKDGKLVKEESMLIPRFGHAMAPVTTGAFAGAVLITGGFTIRDGNLQLVHISEIYFP